MDLLAEQKQFLERVVTSDSEALNLFICVNAIQGENI